MIAARGDVDSAAEALGWTAGALETLLREHPHWWPREELGPRVRSGLPRATIGRRRWTGEPSARPSLIPRRRRTRSVARGCGSREIAGIPAVREKSDGAGRKMRGGGL